MKAPFWQVQSPYSSSACRAGSRSTFRERSVRLGRPRRCPDDVLAQVVAYRMAGARLVDICDQLNADAVPTPGGGRRWYPSHVSRLLRTQDARQLLAQEVTNANSD